MPAQGRVIVRGSRHVHGQLPMRLPRLVVRRQDGILRRDTPGGRGRRVHAGVAVAQPRQSRAGDDTPGDGVALPGGGSRGGSPRPPPPHRRGVPRQTLGGVQDRARHARGLADRDKQHLRRRSRPLRAPGQGLRSLHGEPGASGRGARGIPERWAGMGAEHRGGGDRETFEGEFCDESDDTQEENEEREQRQRREESSRKRHRPLRPPRARPATREARRRRRRDVLRGVLLRLSDRGGTVAFLRGRILQEGATGVAVVLVPEQLPGPGHVPPGDAAEEHPAEGGSGDTRADGVDGDDCGRIVEKRDDDDHAQEALLLRESVGEGRDEDRAVLGRHAAAFAQPDTAAAATRRGGGLLRNTGPERRFGSQTSVPGLGPRRPGRRAELRMHNADDEYIIRHGRTREGVDHVVEQSESLRQGVETYRTDGGAGDIIVGIVAR